MPLQDLIQVAAGTVTGRDHTFGGNLVIGRGNQDAIATAWSADADAFVAVMCDGCSSGEHSEVGAQLGANLILGRLLGWMATADRPPDGVWAFGDYAMLHNGELKRSQFAGNAPPYLGYLLLPADKVRVHQGDLQFRPALTTAPKPDLALTLTTRFATETLAGMVATLEETGLKRRQIVESYFLFTAVVVIISGRSLDLLPLVVGTDGLADVPDPKVFLEDRFFTNPSLVTRYLRQLNQPKVRIDMASILPKNDQGLEPAQPRLIKTDGVLPDDTTLVAIRRKPCA